MSVSKARLRQFTLVVAGIGATCFVRSGQNSHVNASSSSTVVASGEFLPTSENSAKVKANPPTGMAWITGGEFSMGCKDPRPLQDGGHEAMDDARPIHRVYVAGFWMDKTDVSNAQLARFVKATRYVTIAERKPSAKDFPGVPPEKLGAGSRFSPLLKTLSPSTTTRRGGVMFVVRHGVIRSAPRPIS